METKLVLRMLILIFLFDVVIKSFGEIMDFGVALKMITYGRIPHLMCSHSHTNLLGFLKLQHEKSTLHD
jgi:hypothetical protein